MRACRTSPPPVAALSALSLGSIPSTFTSCIPDRHGRSTDCKTPLLSGSARRVAPAPVALAPVVRSTPVKHPFLAPHAQSRRSFPRSRSFSRPRSQSELRQISRPRHRSVARRAPLTAFLVAVLPADVFSPASLLPLPAISALTSVFIVVHALGRAMPGRLEALPLLLRTTGAQLGRTEAGSPLLAGSPVCVIHVLIFFQLLDEGYKAAISTVVC